VVRNEERGELFDITNHGTSNFQQRGRDGFNPSSDTLGVVGLAGSGHESSQSHRAHEGFHARLAHIIEVFGIKLEYPLTGVNWEDGAGFRRVHATVESGEDCHDGHVSETSGGLHLGYGEVGGSEVTLHLESIIYAGWNGGAHELVSYPSGPKKAIGTLNIKTRVFHLVVRCRVHGKSSKDVTANERAEGQKRARRPTNGGEKDELVV
jgi:hypothetical protein